MQMKQDELDLINKPVYLNLDHILKPVDITMSGNQFLKHLMKHRPNVFRHAWDAYAGSCFMDA